MRLHVVTLIALGLASGATGMLRAQERAESDSLGEPAARRAMEIPVAGAREIASQAVAGLRAVGGLRDRHPMDYIRRVSDADWIREEAHAAAAHVAAEVPKVRPGWKTSVLAVVAASVIDMHSSWGKQEANPVLAGGDGRFGASGLAIKSLITGGALGAQWLLLRKKPTLEKYATITNFVLAGAYTRVAVHNYGN